MKRTIVTRPEELFFHALYRYPADWYFGRVNKRTARMIQCICGIDTYGYRLSLTEEYLRHFFNRHFQERLHCQRDLCFNDVKTLSNTVNACYEVKRGNRPNTIKVKTKYPDGVAVFVLEIFANRKTLSGKSLWIENL